MGGWFRKITGQQGQINRQRQALADQEAAARDTAAKQTAAMQESARAAAQAVVQQQERAAAAAAASDLINKPMAEASVELADTEDNKRRKGFTSRYDTGVKI